MHLITLECQIFRPHPGFVICTLTEPPTERLRLKDLGVLLASNSTPGSFPVAIVGSSSCQTPASHQCRIEPAFLSLYYSTGVGLQSLRRKGLIDFDV